jgi:hypothetical protein
MSERSPADIGTSFGCHSTAQDVIQGVDLSGQRAIVTGGGAGIGAAGNGS